MFTYNKDLAIFVPATTAGSLDSLGVDFEFGVHLRDTFGNNPRLTQCSTNWRWSNKRPFVGWVLEISVYTTYQRMPSKVRIALENDIKETLKELSSGVVITISHPRMISKIN